MKRFFTILFLNIWAFSFGQYGPTILGYEFEFKPGAKATLFADNVKFRTAPTLESEVLDLLKIDSEVTIVEKTDSIMNFEGYDSNWYKVSVENKTGYVLGSLISIKDSKLGDSKLKFQFKSVKDSTNKSFQFLKIRVVQDTTYTAYEFPIQSGGFTLHLNGSQGIKNLEGMLVVKYFSEACGEEGGNTYLFWNNKKFYHVADLSAWSDAGMYSYKESFLFPNYMGRVNGKFMLKIHTFSTEDDTMNWTKESTEKRELFWDGEKLNVDLRKTKNSKSN